MYIEMCKEKLGKKYNVIIKNEINNEVNCFFKWKILYSFFYKDRIEFVVIYRNIRFLSGIKIIWDWNDLIVMIKEDRVVLFLIY